MENVVVGPPEGGPGVGGSAVAESRPLRERVLVVVSELGWFEVYGPHDAVFVQHRAGEDNEQMALRVRPDFRDILVGRPITCPYTGNDITQYQRPRLKGWLGNARPEVCRLVWWDRLSELVERYGCAMDCHPLLWLGQLSEATGKEPHDLLHELLMAGREKDSAPQKDAASPRQGAQTNRHQAKGTKE